MLQRLSDHRDISADLPGNSGKENMKKGKKRRKIENGRRENLKNEMVFPPPFRKFFLLRPCHSFVYKQPRVTVMTMYTTRAGR